jgi:hypothetical protein
MKIVHNNYFYDRIDHIDLLSLCVFRSSITMRKSSLNIYQRYYQKNECDREVRSSER